MDEIRRAIDISVKRQEYRKEAPADNRNPNFVGARDAIASEENALRELRETDQRLRVTSVVDSV